MTSSMASPFYRLYDELKDHGIFYNRWRQTKIWLSLEARDGHAADSVKTFLKNVMPDIERVLNQGVRWHWTSPYMTASIRFG